MQTRRTNEDFWISQRWRGISRPYTPADVDRLRGSVHVEHTLAHVGAEKYWDLLRSESYVPALGAVTGDQAVEMAEAGLKAIYVNGGQVYPNQGLYQADSAPAAVRAINNALLRADRVSHSEGRTNFDWMLPVVADADAGFHGNTDAFELVTAMIEAGAAAIHFDDQLGTARNGGPLDAKVLVPTEEAIQKLVAARLAADAMGVPTVIIARTDARSAAFISNDHDTRDLRFVTGDRRVNGHFAYRGSLQAAIARGLSLAPYADLLWCEMPQPNVHEAREFANAIHAHFPGKMLAYNCSPSFQWRAKLNEDDIDCFQRDLAAMGYRFQFVPIAGVGAHHLSMFELAKEYVRSGMTAYSRLQQRAKESTQERRYSPMGSRRNIGHGFFHSMSTTVSSKSMSEPLLSSGAVEERFEVDTVDYNDGEATERTPLPHLYPLLESMPLSSTAAND